jgi:hypothetical protein
MQFAQKQPQGLSFRSQSIGEESACCPAPKRQIPRAILPRFGMTFVSGCSNYITTICFVILSGVEGPL